jgi:translation initiation factor 3 subunit C
MSRFFKGESSSESDSETEELYSDEEEKSLSDEASDDDNNQSSDSDSDSSGGPKKVGINRFLRDAESESDSDSEAEGAKVVKSAKDKRVEEIQSTIKAIDNGKKINDWNVISNGRHAFLAWVELY